MMFGFFLSKLIYFGNLIIKSIKIDNTGNKK